MAPLRVVGAGWGRTGTTSLATALEQLGYSVHNMEAVQLDTTQDPQAFEDAYQQLRHKSRSSDRARIDWDNIFNSYDAVVDWPGAAFYVELLERYADAKCILTTRDPERWWNSIAKTLQPLPNTEDWHWPAKMKATYKMWEIVVRDGDLRGVGLQKDEAVKLFLEHEETVKRMFDSDRLMVIDVDNLDEAALWDELCRFLGHEVVNDAQWPRENQGHDLRSRYGAIKQTLAEA